MKRKRRGRKRRVKHPCDLGWRVRWSKDFRTYFKKLGVWGDVKEFLKGLERDLRSDVVTTLNRLRREPVIAYVVRRGRELPVRRLRLYVRGTGYRLGFIIRHDKCRVWFIHAEKRDEETYLRFRRRFKK